MHTMPEMTDNSKYAKQQPKINYQKKLETILADIEEKQKAGAEPPTLLLHGCCAPCSSYVLEYLSQYFRITELYYNPNISDKEEYDKRASELCRLTASMPQKYPVKVVVPPWDPEPFRRISKGLEEEPEGGARCRACFALRLGEAAKMAKDGGFDYFCTTLSISPLKDSQLLNHLGEAIGKEVGVPYLPSDFKKKEGYKRSIALSREYSLYRQDYCGCSFSREERRRQAGLQAAERKIQ